MINKMRFRAYVVLSFTGIVLFLSFTNCAQSSNSFNTAPTDNNTNATPQPETPTPPSATTIDPWDAPVGDVIQGATLKDGWYDLREVGGSVNVQGGWTDSAAISRDGKSLYFSYSRYSFANLVETGSWTVTGPARSGMTGNHFKNFRADLTSTGWAVSNLPFNRDPNAHESSISTNSDQNVAVFSRWSTNGTVASLYFSLKDQSGNWSEPILLPQNILGSQCSNDNPFIVGDMNTGIDLYFESDRSDINCTGIQNHKHIYHTFYNPTTDQYSAVTKVAGINGTDPGDDDTQFFISADKKHAYWTAIRITKQLYGIFTADVVNGAFVNARPVVLPNTQAPFTGKLTFPGEANIVELPQGFLLYMICGMATKEDGQVKGVNLKICRAKKDKYADEAKKINTSMGWSDSPFISRDGNRLYFTYSRWDFSPWIKDSTKLPVLRGPDRPGLRHNTVNPFDESDIYVATKNPDGTWGEPVNLGLNDDWGDASGMEINNGNTFVWLRGNGNFSQLAIANKNPDGTWEKPVEFGATINVPGATVDNPHISPDGNALFYTSNQTGGTGKKDIWFTAKSAGVWSQPIPATSFNSTEDDDQFFTPPTSMDIYWTGAMGTMHCVSNGSSCQSPPTLLVIPGCQYPAEISMPDDLQTMYFGCGSFTTGRVSIMYSKKNSNGTWGAATPVD